MRIVGADISYSGTGIVDLRCTPFVKPRKFKDELVRAPKAKDEHWCTRVGHTLSMVLERTAAADLVVLEAPAWSMHHGAFKLGQLMGVVEYAICEKGYQQVWLPEEFDLHYKEVDTPAYVYVAPNTLKKFATGSGRAKKDDMVLAAQVYIPGLTNHNIADALFLALWGKEFVEKAEG